jgi:molybdopterin molybdotransferase
MSKIDPNCCDSQTKQKLNALDEVIDRLKQLAAPINSSEFVPLLQANQRVLAEDLSASLNVPPTDNSAVDGYALNITGFVENQGYEISQRIPAGQAPKPLTPGTVARIFTGASIPEGANAVIMQEQAKVDDDGLSVSFNSSPSLQQNIRPLGQDVKSGQVILEKGQVLSPARLGLIASIGIPQVKVFRKLKVAIFSTGDELVEPGGQTEPSQIFNSNRYLLSGMLQSLNMEIIDLGLIADDFEATKDALSQASKNADVIISTGGASVGEEDYVQSAIKALGSIDFWRVAIKPGKPFMYGQIGNTPVLGLPGNPGAVYVTFAVLARPFLLHHQGLNHSSPTSFQQALGFDIKKAGPRREFLRVQRNAEGVLNKHPNQSSGMLSSASWADGFAVIHEHSQPKAGDFVEFIPFSCLFSLSA